MLYRLIVLCTIVLFATSVQAQQVEFDTTAGNFTVELDAKRAPKTVANFLSYVRNGSYNGTIFHRVIKGFMIQGGGLTANMQKKPTQPPIKNEAGNGLQNSVGSIAMARTGDPHSATAQFFINVANNRSLDHKGKTNRGWGYCVFGRVIKGMNVVEAIENTKTTSKAGRRDVPAKAIVINSITLVVQEKI